MKKLGQMLVDTGFLEKSILENALESQTQTKMPLGKILIENGHLTVENLVAALELQKLEIKEESRGGMVPEGRIRLGDRLVDWGLVKQEELMECLEYQKNHPDIKLGEALISRGYLSTDKLIAFLNLQGD